MNINQGVLLTHPSSFVLQYHKNSSSSSININTNKQIYHSHRWNWNTGTWTRLKVVCTIYCSQDEIVCQAKFVVEATIRCGIGPRSSLCRRYYADSTIDLYSVAKVTTQAWSGWAKSFRQVVLCRGKCEISVWYVFHLQASHGWPTHVLAALHKHYFTSTSQCKCRYRCSVIRGNWWTNWKM